MLFEVDQSEPVLEFGTFGPTRHRGLADHFRVLKPTLLKIAQQEPPAHIFPVWGDLPGLFESARGPSEIPGFNRILTFANEFGQRLILRRRDGAEYGQQR